MSNVFTLDSLREETQKRFAPFKVGLSDGSEVTLSSVLRLSSDDRKAVVKALDDISALSDEDESPENYDRLIEVISQIFQVVCDKPAKLLSGLEDPDQIVKVALMSGVLTAWASETQLGEAENSPS